MVSLPLAVAAEGAKGRLYVPFRDATQIEAVERACAEVDQGMMDVTPPDEQARGTFASNAQGRYYGFRRYRDYFTNRQLRFLTTICGLQTALRARIIADGGDEKRANALITYMALVFGRSVDRCSSLCVWDASPKMEALRNTFALQGIQMAWDFAEGNPFSESSGSWMNNVEWVAKVVDKLPGTSDAGIYQRDIVGDSRRQQRFVIVTDPPYYDNIEYSHLSDFFYVWFRRILNGIYPELFSTILVPKGNELVASSTSHGGDTRLAEEAFRRGFQKVFATLREEQDWRYPCVIFYAFKQTETEEEDEGVDEVVASTGWETMLAGLIEAGFVIDGTWPIRSELANRSNARETNSLASSIVLVCRLRETQIVATRREFIRALANELPMALRNLQKGNIAPVDLAQAAIGPGMSVFSRYGRVVEADGSLIDVRTALALINQTLDQVLSEQESEFDPYTRWALSWFEQHGFGEEVYGEAEVLATAKAISVSGLVSAGIVSSRAGKVRLLGRDELRLDLDGAEASIWEVTQHLIRCLDQKGEQPTANLKASLGGIAEIARDLAYRLYTLCERRGWAEEAGYYNSLVVAWPSMASEAFELQ